MKTLFAMLRARGFVVTESQQATMQSSISEQKEAEKLESTWFQFNKNKEASTFNEDRTDTADVSDERSHVSVLLLPVSKLGIALLRKQIVYMKELGWANAIIIVQDGITPQAHQTKKLLFHEERIYVETFTRTHLTFDIMQHAKVPKHRILSRFEIKQLRLNARENKKLLTSDAVACYLGLRVGDAVEITRYTPTARMKVYRVVVNP